LETIAANVTIGILTNIVPVVNMATRKPVVTLVTMITMIPRLASNHKT